MKNVNQVYVKNSLEAALTYCDTFGAEVTFVPSRIQKALPTNTASFLWTAK